MNIKLLTEHHLEFLSLNRDCTGSCESTLVKMPHCLKSCVRIIFRQGSVIMALDYWSVGNPDSRIRRSLESQFSEAMGDIQLGFSYQDAGTVLYINIFYHMMSPLGVK